LFQRFDPAIPLAADDPAYVDWQSEIGLTDVKQQLANSVLLTTHGYSHRLVTGLRGGGKTTELRRLQRTLETRPDGQRYFVSFLDADDTLDLDDADPTDLVLAVVRQLASMQGDYAQAAKRYEDALTIATTLGNGAREADSLLSLAQIAGMRGESLAISARAATSSRSTPPALTPGRDAASASSAPCLATWRSFITVERSTPARSAASLIVLSPRNSSIQISYFCDGDRNRLRRRAPLGPCSVISGSSSTSRRACQMRPDQTRICGVESDANHDRSLQARPHDRHHPRRPRTQSQQPARPRRHRQHARRP
jgi:hypothetical protein